MKSIHFLLGIAIALSVVACGQDKNDCNCKSNASRKIELISEKQLYLIKKKYDTTMNDGRIHSQELLPFFPVEDILACTKHKLNAENFKYHFACPLCGKKSEHLIWINFTSPPVTWSILCGRSGPMSICCECRIPVEFDMELLN